MSANLGQLKHSSIIIIVHQLCVHGLQHGCWRPFDDQDVSSRRQREDCMCHTGRRNERVRSKKAAVEADEWARIDALKAAQAAQQGPAHPANGRCSSLNKMQFGAMGRITSRSMYHMLHGTHPWACLVLLAHTTGCSWADADLIELFRDVVMCFDLLSAEEAKRKARAAQQDLLRAGLEAQRAEAAARKAKEASNDKAWAAELAAQAAANRAEQKARRAETAAAIEGLKVSALCVTLPLSSPAAALCSDRLACVSEQEDKHRRNANKNTTAFFP